MLNKYNLSSIYTVAKYTFKEVLKSKVLVNTLMIGVGLLVLVYAAYSFSYGSVARVALDFGLGSLTISTVAIAIFIGVGILSNEIDSRTVYLVISRPVPRYAFLIGKLLGLSLILFINVIILSVMTLSMYFFIGGVYDPLIFWSLFFIGVESFLSLLVVANFSLISSKVLSVILTLVLYVVGHALDGIKLLTTVKENKILSYIIDGYHFVLPGFYKFNIKDFVLYKQDLSNDYLYSLFSYSFLYSIFLIFLAVFIFEKKSLD